MNKHSVVFVGSSLSMMIGALELANKGIKVAILNNSKNWGGHFSTINLNDTDYDGGMVLYEFTSFNSSADSDQESDILTYDPWKRNDSGRFCNLIYKFVSKYVNTHKIDAPKMYLNGITFDDALIANNLNCLKNISFHDNAEKELETICNTTDRHPLHASNKATSDLFKTKSYEEASLINHGSTIHQELIEPFCKKLINCSSKDIIALYHRVPWLPLYYPETLLSYIQNKPQQLPSTEFSYPIGHCAGDFAKRLLAKIQTNENIYLNTSNRLLEIEVNDLGEYELKLDSEKSLFTNQLAWGAENSALLTALGISEKHQTYEKCSVALLFLKLPSERVLQKFTVLNVIDANVATYRITNQTQCAGINTPNVNLVSEINIDYAESILGCPANEQELIKLMLNELSKLGVIATVENQELVILKQLKNILMIPNQKNREKFMIENEAILNIAPNIHLLGPSSGFFSSSFNDQVVQGIKLASELENLV